MRLHPLVSDHMVLQRNQPLPIWGWAAPGEAVRVTFWGREYPATTGGTDGKWTVTPPATAAGGPYTLRVKGRNGLTIADVLVGDVWLASGQSKMEWPVRNAANAAAEITAADYPTIRRIDVPNMPALRPQAGFGGAGWQRCSPQMVGDFSAVAYFFARDLHRPDPKVSIGLITAEWGGTPAEAWTSGPALRAHPDFAARAAQEAATGTIRAQQAASPAWPRSAPARPAWTRAGAPAS